MGVLSIFKVFKNISFRKIIIFSIVLITFVGVIQFGSSYRTLKIQEDYIRDVNTSLALESLNTEISTNTNSRNVLLRDAVLGGELNQFTEFKDLSYMDYFRERIDNIEKTAQDEQVSILLNDIRNIIDDIYNLEQSYIEQSNSKPIDEIDVNWDNYLGLTDELINISREAEKDFSAERESLENSLARSSSIMIIIIVINSILMIISLVLILGKVLSLEKVKSKIVDIVNNGGDLRGRLDIDSKDEVGDIASEFNELIGQLQIAIRTINNNTEEIHSSLGNVKNRFNDVEVLVSDSSSNLEEMSASSEEQTNIVKDITLTVDSFTSKIETLDITSNKISEEAIGVSSFSEQGAEQVHKMLDKMVEISTSVENANSQVQSLKEQSTNIQNIVDLIEAVAEQTNLLALNATIEAARAGESGKGFSVVAEEIRKLSEEVKKNACDIQEAVKSVNSEVDLVVDNLNSSKVIVLDGHKEMEVTKETIENITKDISSITGSVEGMKEDISIISSEVLNINKGMKNTETIIEQTSEAIESSAEIGSQQMELMSILGENVQETDLKLKDIEKVLKNYKVD